MLRLLGLVAVIGFASNALAKPPMPTRTGQAKELTPMERDQYVPDQTEGQREFVPMLPPSRGKAEESAGMNLLKWNRDSIPKMTLPLGLAQLPGMVTR